MKYIKFHRYFSINSAPDYGKAKEAAGKILDLLGRKPLIDNGSTEGDEIVSH